MGMTQVSIEDLKTARAAGDSKQVEAICWKLLEADPRHETVLTALAESYFQQKEYAKAAAISAKVLSQNPKADNVRHNHATILLEQGELAGAAEHLEKVVAAGKLPAAFIQLAELRLYQHDYAATKQLLNKVKKYDLSPVRRYAVGIYEALVAWLEFKPEQVLKIISPLNPEEVTLTSEHEKKWLKHLVIYHHYLFRLVKGAPDAPAADLPVIHLLGDSHTLSPHGLVINYKDQDYRLKSELIVGAKAFHLALQANNKYKQATAERLAALPEGSIVVCSFGEIDCRQDEGIFPNWQKRGGELEAQVKPLVEAYMGFIINQCKAFGHRPVFYGIPAPVAGAKTLESDAEWQAFLKVPLMFNEAVKLFCQHLNIPFLDPYSITHGKEGVSNNALHIDSHHLNGQVLAQLFAATMFADK